MSIEAETFNIFQAWADKVGANMHKFARNLLNFKFDFLQGTSADAKWQRKGSEKSNFLLSIGCDNGKGLLETFMATQYSSQGLQLDDIGL